MRALIVIGSLVGLVMLPLIAPAAPLDGSAPILCALTSVVECPRGGDCERSTPDGANIPGFVRVNLPQRVLSSVDGTRTSPIAGSQRSNGRLMLQGMQNERVWGAVIEEGTGQMSATVGDDDGAFVISGACVAP
jgi:hypothetical protein